MMESERIKEIDEVEKRATEGPWEASDEYVLHVPSRRTVALCHGDNEDEDAEFIAMSRTAIPELLAERKSRFTAPIVCICGSTKFKQSWIAENARLTRRGNIVLAVGLWGHHERVFPGAITKANLDELHMRKIDLCDWVWVLDVGGYIGESTRNEIEYAEKLGRPIRYLSKEFPGYTEPMDPLAELLVEREEREEEIERLREKGGTYFKSKIKELNGLLSSAEEALRSVADQRNELLTRVESTEKERDFLLRYIIVEDVGDVDPSPGVFVDKDELEEALLPHFGVDWHKDGVLPVIRRALLDARREEE